MTIWKKFTEPAQKKPAMSELTTFIPAGGMGLRLSPHTLDVPKPMLQMGHDKRIIDHTLGLCGEAGSFAWVSVDYLGDQLQRYLYGRSGLAVRRDTKTLGSGGSLMEHYAEMSDVSADGDMLVLPADHIYEGIDITALWEAHKTAEANVTMLTVPNKSYGEYVRIEDGAPVEITTVPTEDSVSTTGIFIISNKHLMGSVRAARLEGREQYNIYGDIIRPAVGSFVTAHYFVSEQDGFWEDAGTPVRYHASNMRLSGGKNVVALSAHLDESSPVTRCVILGDAKIEGPQEFENCIITGRQDGDLSVTQL